MPPTAHIYNRQMLRKWYEASEQGTFRLLPRSRLDGITPPQLAKRLDLVEVNATSSSTTHNLYDDVDLVDLPIPQLDAWAP